MKPGEIVRSVKGRDRGYLAVVVGTTGQRVLIADGQYHLVDHPKPKNPKHLESLGVVDPLWTDSVQNLKDEEIRRLVLEARSMIERGVAFGQGRDH